MTSRGVPIRAVSRRDRQDGPQTLYLNPRGVRIPPPTPFANRSSNIGAFDRPSGVGWKLSVVSPENEWILYGSFRGVRLRERIDGGYLQKASSCAV